MKTRHYTTCSLIGYALAASALMAPMAMAQGATEKPLPVDVELVSVAVDHSDREAGNNLAAVTDVHFSLKSKEEGWVLAESGKVARVDGHAADEGGKPAYSLFYTRNHRNGELELYCSNRRVPEGNRIVLDETLRLTRSKKGRTLSSPVIEIGTSGSFEMGGVRFDYESDPGRYERTERGATYTPGWLTITYPDDVSLASIEVLDEKGKVEETSPGTREKGRAKFTLFPDSDDPGEKRVFVSATWSEADESFDVPLKREITLGSLGGWEIVAIHRFPSERLRSIVYLLLQGTQPVKAPEPKEGVDVRLRKISLSTNENSQSWSYFGFQIKLLVKPSQGILFDNYERQQVLAHDAEGNALIGISMGGQEREDGSFEVCLVFFQFPKGDWVELDSGLKLLRAEGRRKLPSQTIPFNATGALDVGNIAYGYEKTPVRGFGRKTLLENPFVLTYPKDGSVASVDVRDAQGRLLSPVYQDFSQSRRKSYYEINSQGNVQVETTVREGVEPCVIPLKMRVGLGGVMREDNKTADDESAAR